MSEHRFVPSPLADASVREPRSGDGAGPTLVFRRDFRHPPEVVWEALTDPEELGAWAPFLAGHPLDRPGEVVLTMVDGDERVEMTADVRRAEKPFVLEYTWGGDVLRWELEATELGTRLTLHHTVEDRDWIAKVAAGWHLCFDVAERLLDGDPVPPIRGEASKKFGWEELREGYAAKLGLPG